MSHKYLSFNFPNPAFLIIKAIGSAAWLINGETIDRILKLSSYCKQWIRKKSLNNMRKLNVKFLMIDEISMISLDTLNKIHVNIQLAKDSNLPFI